LVIDSADDEISEEMLMTR